MAIRYHERDTLTHLDLQQNEFLSKNPQMA